MTEQPQSAATAIAHMLLELPRETPTIDHATGSGSSAGEPASNGSAPAGAGAGLSLDKNGVAYDASIHVVPPRRNVRGEWARKPGNAQRKAKGAPMAGKSFGAPESNKTPPAGPQAAPAASSQGPISDFGTDPAPAGPAGIPLQPAPQVPLEDYKVSSESLARGFFGGMAIGFGKAWEPEPAELTGLSGALQRVMFHYQLPRVGPLFELVTVLIPIFAKRRGDPETRKKFGGIMGMFRRKSAAPPEQPEPEPESSAVSQTTAPPPNRPEHEPSQGPVMVRKPAWKFL